ncbi:MAG: aminomethyl-transferring glycine dehydrogenase subunit GcvPA [Treponema sp.]|jgi:glycine dehydrogenase subunit 1|nr:aminomethyl-transferring glycine dehydrogenase subunit GcvPA [Treponema sp.]
MSLFIPNTEADREAMLKTIGIKSPDELFADIPPVLAAGKPDIPVGLSELEALRTIESLAGENRIFKTVFRGAGAYRHYIPAAVKHIISKETFLTAYTPYQSEISQGILQAIFEYQSMICEVTGMDAANASVYDGASAAAESIAMCRERNRNTLFIAETVKRQTLETVKTYCFGNGMKIKMIPAAQDGRIDAGLLRKLLQEDRSAACVYLEQPNFFGLIEDVKACAETVHEAGALLVTGIYPISLGILESPGVCGADIACGEGQPLGLPLSFGGPYLGFMACKGPLLRRLPGRIVGETTDSRGERAFVLTLQAREQHIRREKASSNICSNQAYCALTAAVYLSVMGETGFAETASQCHSKAVYAAHSISAIPGFSLLYTGEFFNEFVTSSPGAGKILARLEEEDILGPLPINGGKQLLWCVTELNTKEEIDRLCGILKEKSWN